MSQMRILCCSAHYPPTQYSWGYAQLAEEVSDGLVARGHQVTVLTSNYPATEHVSRPYQVQRLIAPSPDWHAGQSAAHRFWVGRRRRETAAIRALYKLVGDFGPHVILFWNTRGFPQRLLKAAESLPSTLSAYYMADYLAEMPNEYLAYWRQPAASGWRNVVKLLLRQPALLLLRAEGESIPPKYEHVACVSDYVRDRLVGQGLVGQNAVTIHNGIAIEEFPSRRRTDAWGNARPLSCLYAGLVAEHKGVHTIIEAAGLLASRLARGDLRITIVGNGEENYVSSLRRRARDLGIEAFISYRPKVLRQAVPELLDEFDAFLFPSVWDEPLARAMMEAMAKGLVVVGTQTGGSRELLRDGETGLAFTPEDACGLAAQLVRLLDKPDLGRQLAQAGHDMVAQHFSMRRMLDEMEAFLKDVSGQQVTT